MPLSDSPSVYLPYCLARQPDGRYAVLNGEYKPVGFATDRHVQYDQHPVLVRLPGLDPAVAKQVSHDGSAATDWVYLHNDGCVPT